MPTMTDSLLYDVNSFAGLKNKTYANVAQGAQLGLGPNLPKIDAVTPMVMPNAQIIVTHVPTMFDNIPNAPEILCALIERFAQTVDNISPTMSIAELDGIKLQNKQTLKVPGTMTIDDLSPTFTFKEVVGGLVQFFFETWLKMMSHHETGYSQLSSLFQSDSIPPFTYSYFSMDIMVIQPDITLTPENIIDAYFLSCMWPKTFGDIGIKREIGSDGETKDRSVEFSSVLQRNPNTYKVGQVIMDILQMHKVNFDLAAPIATQIEDKLIDSGVTKEIEEIKSEFTDV
jgi:hypothetical protein